MKIGFALCKLQQLSGRDQKPINSTLQNDVSFIIIPKTISQSLSDPIMIHQIIDEGSDWNHRAFWVTLFLFEQEVDSVIAARGPTPPSLSFSKIELNSHKQNFFVDKRKSAKYSAW